MKAYKLEILVIDHEDSGEENIKNAITDCRYYYPSILSIKSAEIGEWHDDHPLNKRDSQKSAAEGYFGNL
jgi:hypothetical protein